MGFRDIRASGDLGGIAVAGASEQPRQAAPRRRFADAAAHVLAHTLANGLEVRIWSDHNIPNVALHHWVRVGSRNEDAGTSGLAHFFEHMMFNGTTRHAQGEFDRLLEARGGSNNAFTSQDVTVYQDWLPSSALDLALELESDRLVNLALRPEVVETEREIVWSERRLRVEDSGAALLEEQVQATAFQVHPYRIPTIGWPADIRSWTMADLQHFYATYYAPNNCTLVLAGDLDPEAALALVDRHFGPVARRAPPPPVRSREPAQRGERRLVLERPAQNPILHCAWHAIAAGDPREPALNILQTILLGGDASRLHRALVEQQQRAVAVQGGWAEGFDPHLFSIQATLPEGGSPEALQDALDVELARLLAHGISEGELRRGKNILAAEFWRTASTIDGKARLLGEYTVLHADHARLFGAPARYEAVTREEVLAVARAVFDPDRRTVGILRAAA